ncbi:MAG: PEGA domain-containing protein [Myxococcales bacterium]|nr:PEGA domain-containing protein [Myxococcales bacterium]
MLWIFSSVAPAAQSAKTASKKEAAPPKGKAPRSTKTDAASTLREQVLAALAKQNHSAAKQLLDGGYRKAPSPELLLLMGRLASIEGRTLDAYDLMRRYLADPARPKDETADREAQQIVAQTPPKASEVRVLGEPGAVVVIDDRIVGVLPLPTPLLVPLGQHALVLEYPEKKLDSPVLVQQGRITEVRSNRATGAMLLSQLPAVLVVIDAPQLHEDLVRRFFAIADEAAQEEQVTLLRPEVALAAAPDLKNCLGQVACWRQLAAKNQTDFLLSLRVAFTALPGAASASGSAAAPLQPLAPASAAPGSLPSAATATAPPPAASAPATAPAAASPPATTAPASASPPPAAVPVQLSLTLLHHRIDDPAAPPVRLDFASPEAWPKTLKASVSSLLAAGLSRPHSLVTIASDPHGAEIVLSDAAIGRAPIEREMWAGSYVVSASHPGFRSERRTVEVHGAQPERVEFDLAPLSFERPAAKYTFQRLSRPRWRILAGVATGTAGLVLLGFGISALAANGSCSEADRIPATGECRYVLQTLTPGAALIGVGTAVLAVGGVLLALPGPRKRVLVSDDGEPTQPAPRAAASP